MRGGDEGKSFFWRWEVLGKMRVLWPRRLQQVEENEGEEATADRQLIQSDQRSRLVRRRQTWKTSGGEVESPVWSTTKCSVRRFFREQLVVLFLEKTICRALEPLIDCWKRELLCYRFS